MRRRSWYRARAAGLGVGAATTALAAVICAAGASDRLALDWLDVHFRYFNHVEASDRILLIDINDYAVERVHSWPWPRSLHADLVNTLSDLGAAAVCMDIVFSEPTPARLEHPALSKDADVDPPRDVRGTVTLADAVRDEEELARALQAAGNVYLAMFYRPHDPGAPVREIWHAADRLLSEQPDISLGRFRDTLPLTPGKPWEDFYQQARIRNLLLADFALTRDELAQRLNTPVAVIERYLAPVKRSVAREAVAPLLQADPEMGFHAVLERVLPGLPYDTLSPDRDDVLRAYRSVRGVQAALAGRPAVPDSLRGRLQQATDITAPLDRLAQAARGVGFVTFQTDPDGVVRRLPVLCDTEGKLVPQLGFSVACHLAGIDLAKTRLRRGRLLLEDQTGTTHSLPIDTEGKTLINWHVRTGKPEWHQSFVHLPVARIMELAANTHAIEQNRARYALRVADAVRLAIGDQVAAYADYEASVRRRNQLRRSIRPEQNADTDPAVAELERIEAAIQDTEQSALEMLATIRQQIDGLTPESDEEAELFQRIRSLSNDLLDGALLEEIEAKNQAIATRNAELSAELRGLVEGRACFVGYTATAVSDFVNVPVFKNMPGVLAHANLANTLLQDAFPRVAPRWVTIVLIGVAGGLVTLLTAFRGPWVSLLSVLVVMAALVGTSAVLFRWQGLYVATIVPALAVFVCWAFITLYRQLTEEHVRRQFSKALAQYTSPAVAAQIASDATVDDLSPRARQVTCFFSDLQGFTSISERLGAERTRRLLNPYLEAMSAVLVQHRAIINKFIGDGIFAFFNPPILACEEHATHACAAALDSLTALARLKAEYADGPLAEDVRALHVRIGISTGEAFVGDYGSASKLDYTCIGDSVNLAARLESANKVFGTRILVSDGTRRSVEQQFVFRCLGAVRVAGKKQSAKVHELVAQAEDASAATWEHCRAFEEGVAAFQQQSWEEAEAAFQHCAAFREEDAAIDLYRTLIVRFKAQPPSQDWDGIIDLGSK